MRPLTYGDSSSVYGHYAAAHPTGATVSISAATSTAGIIGSVRWVESGSVFVLMGLRVGWTVQGAITAATQMDMRAIIVRGFTADNTGGTAVNLSAIPGTNTMRSSMAQSKLSTGSMRVATTADMTAGTFTIDQGPFAITSWPSIYSTNATGTVVTQSVGAGGAMQDLYRWNALGQHPVVLRQNEGILLQPITAGPTTGSVKYYFQWEWAEVLANAI